MSKIIANARNMGRGLWDFLRRRGGQIVYYGGIALALTAIAFAAEQYRGGRGIDAAVSVLPAVELSAPAPAEEEADALYAPEGAELLRAYAGEPQWNGTLELWETHTAVDYRVEGDAVASLSDGIVRAVGRSGAYGGFVEVECGERLLRYASIAPRDELLPGDALKAGDLIGTADASMPGEAEMGAHLHLESIRGDKYEDFVSLTNGD